MADYTAIAATLGYASGIVSTVAYGPQLWHMYKEKCSMGVSIGAWGLWLFSAALITPYILILGNTVLIFLQILSFATIIATIALAKFYQGKYCEACSLQPNNKLPNKGLET